MILNPYSTIQLTDQPKNNSINLMIFKNNIF